MNILEGESQSSLEAGVLGDLVVDEPGNGVRDGRVSVHQGSDERETNLEAHAVTEEASCLEESLTILDPTSTENDPILFDSNL